jgi:hypothetical protein
MNDPKHDKDCSKITVPQKRGISPDECGCTCGAERRTQETGVDHKKARSFASWFEANPLTKIETYSAWNLGNAYIELDINNKAFIESFAKLAEALGWEKVRQSNGDLHLPTTEDMIDAIDGKITDNPRVIYKASDDK